MVRILKSYLLNILGLNVVRPFQKWPSLPTSLKGSLTPGTFDLALDLMFPGKLKTSKMKLKIMMSTVNKPTFETPTCLVPWPFPKKTVSLSNLLNHPCFFTWFIRSQTFKAGRYFLRGSPAELKGHPIFIAKSLCHTHTPKEKNGSKTNLQKSDCINHPFRTSQ